MEQWYYAKGGQQQGPVSLEELRRLIGEGAINPATDLVWNPSMTDWCPAAEIPVLMGEATTSAVSASFSAQPFAYPTATGAMVEVPPGSEPIIATACVKRAFDLTVKHIGPLLLVVIIYFAITIGLSFVINLVGAALGVGTSSTGSSTVAFDSGFTSSSSSFESVSTSSTSSSGLAIAYAIISQIISGLVSAFLLLGATRISLNVVSGRPFSVEMLFGEGDKVIRAFIAQILFGLMVAIGLLLFIFPGIYLALRYSQYLNAIVDKNMGIMDAFNYSASLTENNKMNLFVLFLLTVCVVFAGCLALVVGLLFAYPMIMLMWVVAYRWMQYGGRAVLDDPATGQPMLAQSVD